MRARALLFVTRACALAPVCRVSRCGDIHTLMFGCHATLQCHVMGTDKMHPVFVTEDVQQHLYVPSCTTVTVAVFTLSTLCYRYYRRLRYCTRMRHLCYNHGALTRIVSISSSPPAAALAPTPSHSRMGRSVSVTARPLQPSPAGAGSCAAPAVVAA